MSDEIRRLSEELARDPSSLVFMQLGEALRRARAARSRAQGRASRTRAARAQRGRARSARAHPRRSRRAAGSLRRVGHGAASGAESRGRAQGNGLRPLQAGEAGRGGGASEHGGDARSRRFVDRDGAAHGAEVVALCARRGERQWQCAGARRAARGAEARGGGGAATLRRHPRRGRAHGAAAQRGRTGRCGTVRRRPRARTSRRKSAQRSPVCATKRSAQFDISISAHGRPWCTRRISRPSRSRRRSTSQWCWSPRAAPCRSGFVRRVLDRCVQRATSWLEEVA